VLLQSRQIERALGASGVIPECPGKGALSFGKFETREGRMQVRTTSRRRTVRIGNDRPAGTGGGRDLSCDDSQQLTLGGPLTTTDARPDGSGQALEVV
jgi:hypothetical protein